MIDIRGFKNGFSGTVRALYFDYRKLIFICFLVSAGLMVGQMLIYLSIVFSGDGLRKIEFNMMLVTAFTAFLSLGIGAIVGTGKSDLRGKFFFPVSRICYSIADMAMLYYSSLLLVAMVSFFTFLELALDSLLERFSSDIVLISNLTAASFGRDLLFLFVAMPAFAALVNFVFLFIRRWMIPSLIVLVLLVSQIFLNETFLQPFVSKAVSFIGKTPYPVIILGLLLAVPLLYAMAYIPLKKIEVEK